MQEDNFGSQCGEDRWIAKHVNLPKIGYYVEFGAGDGWHLSNTRWLHAQGWRGLLIEPDPRYSAEQQAKNRPGDVWERCAIGPSGVASIGLVEDDPKHGIDWGMSGELRSSTERYHVPRVPLNELLVRHKVERVDYLSVDVEGMELEALDTLDWGSYQPVVVIVELVTHGLPDKSDQIIDYMTRRGYVLAHKTKYNGIFWPY